MAMGELEYYAGEFSDSDLDALAEAGDYYLDESGMKNRFLNALLSDLTENDSGDPDSSRIDFSLGDAHAAAP